jgi:hypothetical protein
MTRQEAGRIGGLVTAAKYGPDHMAKIGAKGFESYCRLHHNGDRKAAREALKLDGKRRDFAPTPSEWTLWLDAR